MSSKPYEHKRCRYCTLFLRTKSTPIPEDKQGVQRLGPVATSHAEAALATLNARQAAQNSDLPALSFDDTVFADRLHYRDGKSCYNVVSKELKEELPAPAPSADAEQPEPVVRQPARLPRRTELEQLHAGAGELSLDALLDGGTMSVGEDRRRVRARTPMPAAAGGDAGEEAMDVTHAPRLQPRAPRLQPCAPRLQLRAPRLQPRAPRLQPRAPRLQPCAPRLQPRAPRLQPRAPKLQPRAPRLQPRAPRLQPRAPTLLPSAPRLQPRAPKLQPRAPRLQPRAPRLQPRAPCSQWRRGAGRDLTLLRPLGPSRVYHVNILTNRL